MWQMSENDNEIDMEELQEMIDEDDLLLDYCCFARPTIINGVKTDAGFKFGVFTVGWMCSCKDLENRRPDDPNCPVLHHIHSSDL